MNDFNINTKKNEIGINAISNVYSFTSFSGYTNNNYTSTSTCCIDKNVKSVIEKKSTNFYVINLDWFQFICQCDKNGSVFESYSTARINIKKNQTDHHPNFIYRYVVYLDNCELCEIFTVPINSKHKKNEISIKVNNSQLYTANWSERINYLLDELGLIFSKLTKVDIALDGYDIYKKMDLFRRYLRTKTIQINNDNLNVKGDYFNKAELKWDSYTIGSKKYQKSAKIYIKSSELLVSGKQYITEFWKKNGLDTKDEVGRFELKLGTRHLKKYKINSFNDFCDAGYIGKILFDEVHDWLKFYKVSLTDFKSHRKDIAIKKGKEQKFIKWNKIPQTTILLEKVQKVSNGILEAKRSITHTIGEIQKCYTIDSTEILVNYVEATTREYGLFNHTITRIKNKISGNHTEHYELKSLMDRLTVNLSMF